MGATVAGAARDYQGRLWKLDDVVAAVFVEYTPRHQLRLWTLLDSDEPKVDAQIAQIHLDLEETFREHVFDFSTIHLRGRQAAVFIPKDALVVVSARRRADAR